MIQYGYCCVPIEFSDLKDTFSICNLQGYISKCSWTNEYIQMSGPSLSPVNGPLLISAHIKIYGTSQKAMQVNCR